jgi:mRNA interferase MazF
LISEPYCPEAGDLVWIEFDPQQGLEQRGRGPALVLTPRRYNQRSGLCVLCPITSRQKGYPFEVAIPAGHSVAGVVLSDQVESLSWQMRGSEFAGRAPAAVLQQAKGKIKALLQLS